MLVGALFSRRLKDFRNTEDVARRDEYEGAILLAEAQLSLRLNFIVVGRSRSITAWSEGPLPRLIEPLLGRFGRKWS